MPDTPEWVRVKDNTTGHHFTIHSTALEGLDGVTVLKQDAVDANGSPLLDKPRVDKGSTRTETATATERESR